MMRPRPAVLTLLTVLGVAARAEGLQLDPTFGSGGEVATFADEASATALALQADGKILAVGSGIGQGYNGVVLVRYTNSGVPDPSFGNAGIAENFVPLSSLYASAVALQADGKILVAGTASATSGQSFFVARFLTNGDPDPSFGIGGFAITAFPGGSAGAAAIALQPDGKIVAAGGVGPVLPQPNDDFAAARYNVDGSLDSSFGTGGRVVIDMGGRLPEWVAAVVVEADGRIVLGGQSDAAAGTGFAMAGLLPDGSLDSSFGVSGKLFLSLGISSDCKALALQRDGQIVAAGSVSVPDGMLAVRLRPDGSLDPGFGTGGIATIPAPRATAAVALDSLGRIVLAGYPDFVLARLLPSGQPDQTVGPQGWLSAGLDAGTQHHAQASSLAVQQNGAILLGGDQEIVVLNSLVLLRYLGAPAAVPTLSEGFALLLVGLLGAVGWAVLSKRA